MIPTSATSPASTPSSNSAMIGIASLILEGRALSDDDFILSAMQTGGRVTNSGGSNYNTTNSSTGSNFSSHAMDSDPTVQHFQRLRQKLGQLRHSSPGTSRDNLPEQEIVVGPSGNALNAARNADDSDDGELDQFVEQIKPKTANSHQVPDSNLLYTLQSLASTCLRTTPRSFSRNRDVMAPDFWFNSTSSHAAATMKSFPSPSSSKACISSNLATSSSSSNSTSSTSSNSSSSNSIHQIVYANQRIAKIQQLNRGEKIASPKQGPHCDQFLKKLGLGKGEASEVEEHICDMANLNEICYRWHIHCRQIEIIMSRCDPICIEVYLGPESHEILLEQWIIQKGGKSETPNMTLQSLCNAIRSQLYFSQITAWSDLLRKVKPFDKEIQENGRIRTPSNNTSGGSMQKKPRLDIFYRIKAYDSTACFNAKPNVHNFPNINLLENNTVSVCLKSLPRLQGGIPEIGDFVSSNHHSNHHHHHQHHYHHHSVAISSTISNTNDEGEQQQSARDDTMMLDDRLNLPCQEKGKHKCVFNEEDDGSSDTVGEGSCSSGMSHREKQLLKYRKRMMKRDRKSKKAIESRSKTDQCQPMQLEEKRFTDINNLQYHCPDLINNQQAMHEFGSINSINSIRPPLYQTTTIVTEAVQTNTVEMISIGTQTADFSMHNYPACENCGHDRHLVCWNCEKKLKDVSEPPKLGKGDILLQAIQRTPQRKNQDMGNNNNSPDLRGISNSSMSNCQLCKRQKTGHHYGGSENGVFKGDCNITESKYSNLVLKKCTSPTESPEQQRSLLLSSPPNNVNAQRIINKFPSKKCGCLKPLRVRLEHNCDASIQDTDCLSNGKCMPLPVNTETDILLVNDISAQFKTPKANISAKNQLKPNVLPISHSEKLFKSLPKVNLSNLFCSPSSPIPIISPDAFTFDNETPEIPVQKSNSAPTLPNSPSLSPRFLKQAAIYKRRSRHLSDRSSERSSFGSDEQFSDEDLDSVYSPTSSPVKNKTFLRCNAFGRRPLLGNLEESLLQKRFTPKTQVAGFKVLLGASGAYCPTQLTIPAAAYFFELSGRTLSTPYVCEIRLSRKGYTIPRTGTVQATLLNPLGTVVRMFVIPYDFRDMPPMNQTFIRQRILAIDSDGESPIERNCNSSSSSKQRPSSSGFAQFETPFQDHMHSLRYSIHLRFQTSRSGRLALHTDIRFLISRRTDCDTAAAHAKGALESPNDLRVITITPEHPKYSARQENPSKI